VLLLVCFAGQVTAEIVTVHVEGIVDEVITTGPYDLDGSVVAGTLMSGYCVYDTATADLYVGTYPLLDISMSVGDYVFSHEPGASGAGFKVYTDDGYLAESRAPIFEGLVTKYGNPIGWEDEVWGGRSLQLMDVLSSHEEYFSHELPDADTFPPFWVFDSRAEFSVGFAGDIGGFAIEGSLTDVRAVPEPGTVVLLGLGVLAAARRRKKA
jgi:hypothetical protein